MTNKEAVKELEAIKPALDNVFSFSTDKKAEALDLAIKALKKPVGKWIYHKSDGYFLPTMECSNCHANDLLGGLTRKEYKVVNKFCWNCGAKMEGGGT